MFHICKGPLLASPSLSEILFLILVRAFIEGRAVLELAGEGLG